MSPDEVLILCPYDAVDETLAKMHIGLAKAHALAVDVSDARAVFRVSGENAREVMAKLAPVDFSPEAFGPGTFRRSRMAQVAAAFWMSDEKTFQIVCFRSQAQYVFDLLRGAAQKGNAADFFR
jgi:sarcosine oxidase subunit gamma